MEIRWKCIRSKSEDPEPYIRANAGYEGDLMIGKEGVPLWGWHAGEINDNSPTLNPPWFTIPFHHGWLFR